jgi:hypothetical protein
MAEQDEIYNGNDNESQQRNQSGDGDSPGNPPVARTADDEPVWLNTSKDEETIYLSVSKENGESIAIFANHPILRLALQQIQRLQR